jgi:glycosyltransferase involved in cell wall biosynthesis
MRDLLAAHLGALIGHPRSYLRHAARVALRPRPPRGQGPSGVAGLLLRPRRSSCGAIAATAGRSSHIHAHHAAAPADVAMLAAALRRSCSSAAAPEHLEPDPARPQRAARRAAGSPSPRRPNAPIAVVCISDFARSQLMALLDANPTGTKMRVVHCGVNPADYARTTQASRAGRVRSLLCVGRLVAEKGHAVLLERLSPGSWPRAGIEVEAVLVGSGPLQCCACNGSHDDLDDRRARSSSAAPSPRTRSSRSYARGHPVLLARASPRACRSS